MARKGYPWSSPRSGASSLAGQSPKKVGACRRVGPRRSGKARNEIRGSVRPRSPPLFIDQMGLSAHMGRLLERFHDER